MTWLLRIYRTSLGKKYLMACTGLLLGCFLVVHAAGNSSIFFGRAAFLAYARHLHALGFALTLAELALLTTFLLHVVTGMLLFIENRGVRASRYQVQDTAGGSTWASRTMPYTGVIIFLFILMHVVQVHFADHTRTIADIVATILGRPLNTVLYAIGLFSLLLHVFHGFWSMFQTMGINHPLYNNAIRVSGQIAGGLITATFLLIILVLILNGKLLAP